MARAPTERHEIAIPPLRLDPRNECVWQGDRLIRLGFKAFELLAYLSARPGQIVRKQELLDALWPDTTVSDGVLKVHISEIRKALDDRHENPSYIETVHGRGYRFIGESQAEISSPEGAAALLEREEPLRQLQSWFKECLSGYRRMAFVTGEPGSGKTALVRAFVDRLFKHSGVRIAQGQCLGDRGGKEPFFAVLEGLSDLARNPAVRLAEALRRHAPAWLAELPSLQAGGGKHHLECESPVGAEGRMIREFAELLRGLTQESPLVLILEDLHWSDSSTLDLIGHLARRRDRGQFLFVGTYRLEDASSTRNRVARLGSELVLRGHCQRLVLTSLSEAAVAACLDLRCPGNRFPVELAELIHRETGGNPLSVVALIGYLVESGRIASGDEGWSLGARLEEIQANIPVRLRREPSRMRRATKLPFRPVQS